MGYDVHVTRAKHWSSTAGHEISAAEWQEVVTWDPDLNLDKSHGTHAVVWVDNEGTKRGWFDWYDGAVYTTDPDAAAVEKPVHERLFHRRPILAPKANRK